MAFSVPSVAPTVVLGTSATTLYTVPNTSGKYAIVKSLTLCNTTTSAVTVTLYRSPTAGTTTDAFAFMKDAPSPPKSPVFIDTEMILGQNEAIKGLCSATSSVTVMASVAGEIT